MTLMEILIECENALGWIPRGQDIYKARAMTHKVLTTAMTRQRVTLPDVELALAYCKRKRLPITTSPLELLTHVKEARRLAGPVLHPNALDLAQAEAIAWEHQRLDDESTYWIGRIVNSLGAGLDDVLIEWHAAGRGH